MLRKSALADSEKIFVRGISADRAFSAVSLTAGAIFLKMFVKSFRNARANGLKVRQHNTSAILYPFVSSII